MENAPVDEIILKAIFRNIGFPSPLDTRLRAAQYGPVRWEPPVAAKSDRAAIGDVLKPIRRLIEFGKAKKMSDGAKISM
jgi:hypothetical protein